MQEVDKRLNIVFHHTLFSLPYKTPCDPYQSH